MPIYMYFHLSIKDLEIKDKSNRFKIFIYIHKIPFDPQKPDHLEKLVESLLPLQLSSRKHFAKIEDKKSYCKKLDLRTLQLEFSLALI